MNSSERQKARAHIRALVERINDAWRDGRSESLNEYFHPDMVIRGPALEELCRGRDASVRSYADFVAQAVLHDLRITDLTIEIWNDTAVATYRWNINYTMGGHHYQETGHDLFVFAWNEGKWQAVWRMLLPGHPAEANQEDVSA